MFGKNKVSQEDIERLKRTVEIDDQFFADTGSKGEMFHATMAEIKESHRQVEADVAQVKDNVQNAAALAAGNVEIEAGLGHAIGECRDALVQEEKQKKLVLDVHQLYEDSTKLVDDNKHFTTPSKYLSEFPGTLKSANQQFSEKLDRMQEYGKQMGVLALNAAIEAGRLGESGKQFVTAAEDIRSYAANYDAIIAESRTQLAESKQQIAELEEQMHHLIGLLKENNIATARLMKSCAEVTRGADAVNEAALSSVVNDIVGLRNADEEIVKSEERNRMQLEDLAEEFHSQQKNQQEIGQMVDPLYRHVIERKAGE
mgnify:CR=1 FL=1